MENRIEPDFTALVRSAPSARPKEMLTVRRDGEQTFVRINSSSLSIIQACPRKAQLALHQKWKSRSGSSPLIFGNGIHKALECFYAHPARERTVPPDYDEIAPLLAHGHAPSNDHFIWDAVRAFVREAEPLRMLPDTDKRSLASGIWLLGHYFRTYCNDTYVIHSDAQGPIVERSFSVPLHEEKALRIELHGQIDFALRNEVTGEVLIGDHKTSSQMGSDFLNRIKPNHQYTGYILGAQQALGIQSENFLVNGIQVKARPLTSRGTPPHFVRQLTRRTAQDIAEFKDVILWAVRSYLAWEATGVWPQGSVDACSMWGGCTYLQTCSAPNELRQTILEGTFMQEGQP